MGALGGGPCPEDPAVPAGGGTLRVTAGAALAHCSLLNPGVWWGREEQHRFGSSRDANQLQSTELSLGSGTGLVLTWSPGRGSEKLVAQNS